MLVRDLGSSQLFSLKALARRSVSISAVVTGAVLFTVTLPLWLPGAWLLDRIRGRAAVACLTFIHGFLLMEIAGLAALFAVFLLRPGLGARRYADCNFAIQTWWAGSLYALARRLFGLRLEVTGQDQARAAPHVLLPRHVSFGDTIFACVLISAPYGVRHRYVLKSALRWDPCIDVAGHRLGCCFVERGQGLGDVQSAAIAAACADLAPGEGVLIYPEGTRHTPAKRAQRLDQLRRRDPQALAEAEQLERVLYPHTSGAWAAFQGAGFPDALFMAHTGFEGSANFASLWRGDLRGACVRLRFWRVPAGEIPRELTAFRGWLVAQWQRMDREVAALEAAAVSGPGDGG